MATIRVRRLTIKKKNGNQSRKITARRVVVNNQVQKLQNDANTKRAVTRR